jgi:F0F1-type ATP synthase assembly protein I
MDEENKSGSKPSEKKQWVEAEKLVQIGVMLPLALVIGYFVGAWLDGKFGTTWIKIVGILLGIAAGFVQLIRLAGSEGKK